MPHAQASPSLPEDAYSPSPRPQDLDEQNRLFGEAKNLPLSPQRLAVIKDVWHWARRHHAKELQRAAGIELTWNAIEAGDVSLALASFSRSLEELWSNEVSLPATDIDTLMRQFLWMPQLLARHPTASRQLVSHLQYWMDYFTSHSTIPASDRWAAHHQCLLGLGQRHYAQSALDASQNAQANSVGDEYSHEGSSGQKDEVCALHAARLGISWEVTQGDYVKALILASRAQREDFASSTPCSNPEDLSSLLMIPLAWAGRGEEAWQAHVEGHLHQAEESQYLGDLASHLRFCAMTWDFEEGLDVLITHADWFANPEDLWDLLSVTRAAAALLKMAASVFDAHPMPDRPRTILDCVLPGNNPWHPFPTLDHVELSYGAHILTENSINMALRYDLRNGNDTVSRRTHSYLYSSAICPKHEVADLLKARAIRNHALSMLDLRVNHASWVLDVPLPDPSTWGSWLPGPCEEGIFTPAGLPRSFPLPNSERKARIDQARKLLRAAQDLTIKVPLGACQQVEDARWLTAHAALECLAGNWESAATLASSAVAIYLNISDTSHALAPATYLVQALWAQGRTEEARDALIQADSFINATTHAQAVSLIEDLSYLAG
ncbi:MAG: tetratricopeptide repeat protein [Actinomycetaceae bacterium]|nr:tetratricopeptide repeat protein [Actinomycetaceae bacterium]